MCQELVVTMATAFWQACFPKFVILRVCVNKYQLKWDYFYIFAGLKHIFIHFEYFAVIFGGFLAFWKNFEIQDGGSKMADVLTSWCNCHVMWRHHPTWRIPKERVSDVQYILYNTFWKLHRGGFQSPPPPVWEGPKKPGLNRVVVLNFRTAISTAFIS